MSKITLFRQQHIIVSNTPSPRISDRQRENKFAELAKPKFRPNTDDDLVGPGKYDPKDYFLSTKTKSPSVIMNKSSRFLKTKLPPLEQSPLKNCPKGQYKKISMNFSSVSPSFSFKRTGHNLKLVENPDFPGAGGYSPDDEYHEIGGFSFHKAKRELNWKKCKKYIVKIGIELGRFF